MARRSVKGWLAAILLIVLASMPTAAAVDDYHWDTSYGGFVDRYCGGTHYFEVDFYQDANYGGRHVKVCSIEGNFCYVPIRDTGSTNLSCDVWGDYVLNDQVTSFKVRYVATCRKLWLYPEAGYGGQRYNAVGNVANVGSAWNDSFSSARVLAWC